MDLQNEKCVMVIDENLPLGIIANTAAIMGITMGKQMPEVVGADVYDRTGNEHLGIIRFPVPILKGNGEVIKTIRERLYEPEFSDLTVVGFPILSLPLYFPFTHMFLNIQTAKQKMDLTVMPYCILNYLRQVVPVLH